MSRIKDRHERLIEVLITARSVAEAAKVAGMSERHIWRLLAKPEFKKRYAEAAKNHLEQATCTIQAAMIQAVTTLRTVMDDPLALPAAKVSAAKVVLEIGYRAFEMNDIEKRITALEEGSKK